MTRTHRRPSTRRESPPLRRALGQHHLRDGRTAAPLVEYLRLEPGATVIEIGPGGGALTGELLARRARVVAIELDPLWAFALRARLDASEPSLSIVVGDALELDWRRLPKDWRVAGNLPYNVGTPVVERLLAGAPVGLRAGFLLQREVVDRMVARPGDPAYGALSLLVAVRARAERLAIVRPGAFVPPPRVDSAFVGLVRTAEPLPPAEMAGLERVIRAAFAQRRKQLRNALGAVFGREAAESALAAAGVGPSRRAEELGLEEFLALRAALPTS